MNVVTVTRPVFQLVEPDPEILAKIQELETQVAATIALIVGAKLTFEHTKILKYVPEDVLKSIAEHCIATNTLKHILIKAKNNRIKDIKKGL